MVPGWFKSELSAAGAKWDVENTPKGTCLICIFALRSRYALPAVAVFGLALMMENLGREWCAWCLGWPRGFGCSGGARRRSWCSHWTPRQASSHTLWVLDLFSSLLVTNYGLLVIKQCKRIVIFSLHMMIETHLTAHSGIYMTAKKSYFHFHQPFFISPQKENPIKPTISISDSAPLNPLGPL